MKPNLAERKEDIVALEGVGPTLAERLAESEARCGRAEQALRENRRLLAELVENSGALVVVKDDGGLYQLVNHKWEEVTGLPREVVLGKADEQLFSAENARQFRENDRWVIESGATIETEERLEAPGGARHFISIKFPLRDDAGTVTGLCGIITEVTARKRAEEALHIFKESLENSTDAIGMSTAEGRHYYQNKAFSELFGPLGDNPSDVYADKGVAAEVFQTIMAGKVWTGEVEMYGRDGGVLNILLRAYANKDDQGNVANLVGVHTDITAQRQAEVEREKMQAQLAQAQRMESVGRLAGGVAHDFNNMLGVILGHSELALMTLAADHPLYSDLIEIQKAAKRSADLTRQLLAFARKQTATPVVMDLNDTITGMLKMLGRLIGEDIDLAWQPGKDLWPIMIDPSQVDQIMANLCVNARDAIAGVGKVTIETQNAIISEEYCASHSDSVPGAYVVLAVSDNGCGMDRETVQKVFDPFFTTKKVGEGTGLGLSTVYGIVRQNDGFISVYSEPGQGTTFRLFLPRISGADDGFRPDAAVVGRPRSGHETILLVEDEAMILKLAKNMLEYAGYRVLTAATPGEAIQIAAKHLAKIHLLVTDVIMPEMNGHDLAKRILEIHPNLKRMFMSGYTASVIAHHGVLDKGIHFLQKPFSLVELAAKVREALDS